jgi:hypothetical protein
LNRTQWGFPTLTPVKVRERPAASIGCPINSSTGSVQGKADGANVARPMSTVTGAGVAPPVEMQINCHEAAFGLHGKMPLSGFPCRMEVAGKNSETVAGFFRFAAVGIEDAEAKIRFLDGTAAKMPSLPNPQ